MIKNDLETLKIGPMVTRNKMGRIVCRHPWTSFDISPDGGITPCCYFPSKIVGNINKNTIEEIWNGKEYVNFRKEMSEKGASAVCPSCSIMSGMKHWETFEWYKDLDQNSEVYKNAELNEHEIFEGKSNVESKIRRLKYTPSFQCNLSCYHCCQDQYRNKGFFKLNKDVFQKVIDIFPTLQIINPFGGEPFIFPETNQLLEAIIRINPVCKFYTTTNANYLPDRTLELLEKVSIMKIAISLDGYTKESYEKFRAKSNWELLHRNIEKIAAIRDKEPFILIFNASFNNQTYKELPVLLELCKKYNAIGKISFVQKKSNHNYNFWKKYIKMSKTQIKEFNDIIDLALKIPELPLDTKNSLINTKKTLGYTPFNEFALFKRLAKRKIVSLLKITGLFGLVRDLYKSLIKK